MRFLKYEFNKKLLNSILCKVTQTKQLWKLKKKKPKTKPDKDTHGHIHTHTQTQENISCLTYKTPPKKGNFNPNANLERKSKILNH